MELNSPVYLVSRPTKWTVQLLRWHVRGEPICGTFPASSSGRRSPSPQSSEKSSCHPCWKPARYHPERKSSSCCPGSWWRGQWTSASSSGLGTAYLPIHLHKVLGIGEEGRRVEDLPPQPIGLNGLVLAHDPSDGQLHVEQLVTELCHPCAQHHEKSLVVGSWIQSPGPPTRCPSCRLRVADVRGYGRKHEVALGCSGRRGDARGDAWVVGTESGLDPASVPAPAPTIPALLRAHLMVLILMKLASIKIKCLQALHLWGGRVGGEQTPRYRACERG